MSEKTITQPKLLDKVKNEMRTAHRGILYWLDKEVYSLEYKKAINSVMVKKILFQDNTILPANEQIDFTTLIFLFFCSFTEKTINGYKEKINANDLSIIFFYS